MDSKGFEQFAAVSNHLFQPPADIADAPGRRIEQVQSRRRFREVQAIGRNTNQHVHVHMCMYIYILYVSICIHTYLFIVSILKLESVCIYIYIYTIYSKTGSRCRICSGKQYIHNGCHPILLLERTGFSILTRCSCAVVGRTAPALESAETASRYRRQALNPKPES